MKGRILAVTAFGTFLVLLAYTVPLGTLDLTAAGLGASVEGRAWIASAMSVGLAAALLAAGALADAQGRKRVFRAGALLLGLGSLGAAVAPSTLVFVVARLAQGIGGAALTACSLGIVGQTFSTPTERTRATGIWGASLGAGIAVGPLVSAGLALPLDWRASHAVCAVLAVLIYVASGKVLPETAIARVRRFDVAGSALLGAGIAALVGGLIETRGGWLRPTALGAVIAGAALLVGFAISQARRADPLLDLRLFRRPDFTAATAAAFANGLGIIALISFASTLLTAGFGLSVLAAALLILTWSGSSVLSAIAMRSFPEATATPRVRLIASLLVLSAGQLLLGRLAPGDPVAWVVVGLVVAGVASGVLNATLARQSIASVPPESAAVGGGANNTARYLGAAFGMMVVAMLVRRGGSAAEVIGGWDAAAYLSAGFSLAGALAVAACRWAGPETEGAGEGALGREAVVR